MKTIQRVYKANHKAIETPWGISQSRKLVGEGMEIVSTAGHGGIWLSDDRLLCLPVGLRNLQTFCGLPNWFEEDIDAILPVLAFPAEWDGQACWNAVRIAEDYIDWHPTRQNPIIQACRDYLTTTAGMPVRDKAKLWAETNRINEKWERGSLSSDPVGWWVSFTQVKTGERREVLLRDYPSGQFWSEEEIEKARAELPPVPPLPPGVESCADLPQRLTFDGEPSYEDDRR